MERIEDNKYVFEKLWCLQFVDNNVYLQATNTKCEIDTMQNVSV